MAYKIQFEYKDAGKKGGPSQFQRQRQQLAGMQKKQISSPQNINKSINQTKNLDSSIKKLIDSNKKLERAVQKQARTSALGGAGKVAGGAGKGASLGGIGASIPIAGAALGITGFAISKINQVADAYISLAGQQKGTAGIAGMYKKRQGMFLANEVASGIKSYTMQSGKFSGAKEATSGKSFKAAIQMGNVFGTSPEETMRQSGIIKRAGGDYSKTLYGAAGAGIETELPTLMQGIASTLEEAVKNGVNSSDMARDLGKEMTSLTMATQTQSVDAAMRIVQTFKGTQQQITRGQVGGYQQIMGWKAGQTMLQEQLSDPKQREAFIKKMQESGVISEQQSAGLGGLSGNVSMQQIQDIMGVGGTKILTERTLSQAGEATALRYTMAEQQKIYGKSIEGKQQAWNVYSSMNPQGMSQEQFFASYESAGKGLPTTDTTQAGEKIVSGKSKQAMRTEAGISAVREGARQGMTFEYGAKFAETSLKFEKSMMKLADTAMPAAEGALLGLNTAAGGLNKTITAINKELENIQKVGFKKYLKDLINPFN